MKAPHPWRFLKIYLLVIGSVGCFVLSIPVAFYCAIGGGCHGEEIFSGYANTIFELWPLILLFLMPLVIFGGAVFLSLKEGRSEK